MRSAKILGLLLGGLIVVVALTLAAVWLFVNPNDFKPRIETAVKNSTGRTLDLHGDIKLSVFPWVALQLGPASLGNPTGFGDQPFLSFQSASVRVRLLPLIAKRLQVGRIEIAGLDLRLLKNAAGVGNWQDLSHADRPADPAAAKSRETLQGIAGIKVTDARVSFEDITAEHLNFETGSIGARGLVPVSLHVEVIQGAPARQASIDGRFNFSADMDAERYSIAALNVSALANRGGGEPPVRINLTAPSLVLDRKANSLDVPNFTLDAAGAELSGSIEGTHLDAAVALTGTLALAPLVVREYLPRVGVALPRTRDPKALSLVSASGQFEYGGNAAHFKKLEVTLDDTRLNGALGVDNLETNALAFDLAVDHIDLDRYLPPADEPAAKAPTPAAAAPSKPLNANGTLAIGSLSMAPLELMHVQITVATHDRVMHVFPIKAQIKGGQYSGDVTVDDRTASRVLSLDEHLTGIDMGKLLAKQAKYLHVTGLGDVNLKATGHGVDSDGILKTLGGHFDMNVAGGAVEGVDLGFEIARADALLRRQDLGGLHDTKRTPFNAFKMTAALVNGVASSHDLLISSPVLKITGQGTANLPTKAINFQAVADTLRTASNVPVRIPMTITGTMADPVVRPDVQALAKGVLKQKLQDTLQDKLKGLFN